jgi:hypothetical protein
MGGPVLQLVPPQEPAEPALTFEEEMGAIHDAVFAVRRLERCEGLLPDYTRRAMAAGDHLLSRYAFPAVTEWGG